MLSKYNLNDIEKIVCLALSETFLFTFSTTISLTRLEKYLFGTGRKKNYSGANFFGELKNDDRDEFYRILNKFEELNLIDRNFDNLDEIHIHEQLYILAISIMNKFFSEKD